jgi:hypothetical protein
VASIRQRPNVLIIDRERKRPFLPELSELLPVLLDAAISLDPICRRSRRHVRSLASK